MRVGLGPIRRLSYRVRGLECILDAGQTDTGAV